MSDTIHDLTILHLQHRTSKDTSIQDLARLYFETHEAISVEVKQLKKEFNGPSVYFPDRK